MLVNRHLEKQNKNLSTQLNITSLELAREKARGEKEVYNALLRPNRGSGGGKVKNYNNTYPKKRS